MLPAPQEPITQMLTIFWLSSLYIWMDLDNNINLTLQVTCPWRRAWQPTPVFLPGESPWPEEPGGLQSTGSQRVGHDWATKHTAQLYKISLGSSLLVLSSVSLFNLLVVQSVMSNSLWANGVQHARLPCPSPSPRVCSNSCPLSWWRHLTISSPATPLHPLSRHQGLFQRVGSSHKGAKVLQL